MASDRASKNCEYADLFDRLLDAALLVDVERFEILDCNDAAERVFGFSREHLNGKSFLETLPDAERSPVERALRMAKRRYYPRVFELSLHASQMEVSACALKTRDDSRILQIILRDVTAIRAARKKLEELSVTDELTSLANVRYFKSELLKECERGLRYNHVFSLIFCDIDYFKKLNDQFGHAAGDAALKEFAQRIRAACRNTDLPARYGGEEFVVLCTGVNWEGAAVLAERIRKSCESKKFELDAETKADVTVSCGIASFPEHGNSMDQILAAADAALYEAKHAGRNQWKVSNVRTLATQSTKDSDKNSSTHRAPSRRDKKSG